MNNDHQILDYDDHNFDDRNYRKRAVKLLLYAVIINLGIFYFTANFLSFSTEDTSPNRNILILSLGQWLFLILGGYYAYLSVKRDEPNDWNRKIAVWGIGLLVIFSLLPLLF